MVQGRDELVCRRSIVSSLALENCDVVIKKEIAFDRMKRVLKSVWKEWGDFICFLVGAVIVSGLLDWLMG